MPTPTDIAVGDIATEDNCNCDDNGGCVTNSFCAPVTINIEAININCDSCCGEGNGPVTPPVEPDEPEPEDEPEGEPEPEDEPEGEPEPGNGGCPNLGRTEPCDQSGFSALAIESPTLFPGRKFELSQLDELDGTLFLSGTIDTYGSICRLNENDNTLSHLKISAKYPILETTSSTEALYALNQYGNLLKLDKDLNLQAQTRITTSYNAHNSTLAFYQEQLYLLSSRYLYQMDTDLNITRQCDIGTKTRKGIVVNDQGIFFITNSYDLVRINLEMTEQQSLTFGGTAKSVSTLFDNNGKLLVAGSSLQSNFLAHISYDLADVSLQDLMYKKIPPAHITHIVPACDDYLRLYLQDKHTWVTTDRQGCGWAILNFDSFPRMTDGLRRSNGELVWLGKTQVNTTWLYNEKTMRGDTMATGRHKWPGDWFYVSSSEVTTTLTDTITPTISTTTNSDSGLTTERLTLSLSGTGS